MWPNNRHRLQVNIPSMITFLDSPIDQSRWENEAHAVLISDTEVEVDLMALTNELLGHSSIPAVFGRAFLEKFPNIIHQMFGMDKGFISFMMGIPRWAPLPAVTRAHIDRENVRRSITEFWHALDAVEDGIDPGYEWDEMEDVSAMIKKRQAIYRANGFKPRDRCEIAVWLHVLNFRVQY
jgi:hypothetical protein